MRREPVTWSLPNISVIILTKDEERNIEGCLRSLTGLTDIHVVDSGSSDRTVEIAEKMLAKVSQNTFRSFGDQRNWAHDNAPIQHEWILHLDADERATPELLEEIRQRLAGEESNRTGGYFIAAKDMFMGRWLRHAAQYPVYQCRLVHRDRCRFADEGHGQREDSAHPMLTLSQPYIHYPFSHGIERWMTRHVRYAREEAAVALRDKVKLFQIFSFSSIARRRALKSLAMRMPFRPTLRWIHIVILRLGFLDGHPGLIYARMRVMFQQMIDIQLAVQRSESDKLK